MFLYNTNTNNLKDEYKNRIVYNKYCNFSHFDFTNEPIKALTFVQAFFLLSTDGHTQAN